MAYKIQKAVVTGATGVVGMALLSELILREIEVTVLVKSDLPGSERIPRSPLVRRIECPLEQMASLDAVHGERHDAFFHFAWVGTTGEARNEMHLQNENVKYTLDAVALAERMGCHTFLGAGSQAEYGRVEGVLTPKSACFPENGYGMAKLCAGQMSRVLCEQKGIRHLWARILSVYGPYDGEGSLVISTIRKLLDGKKPPLTAGEQIWDYLYSADAAKALLAIAESGVDGGVYCLGSGKPQRLRAYIEKLRDAVNPEAPLGFGELAYAPRQVMHLCADISDLVRDTGFVPSTPFEEGIRQTVLWAQETQSK